ncbi:Pro-resilin precursor, putative [Pediculus humanus corporis]|uniref:Pro-resilin, putative n=1 Tax=Pediculus humanus subsp. corporis TaxID=121224 RepID=E0VR93_PEDHC|nr:Pro-resilin precursor, putative [Pediculus humanus corporis]EEB15899.1 Pro-resilin precursor, putative [Pediculus humanus corporis]
MAKVFFIFVSLLAVTLAEPPVKTSYLPPSASRSLNSQYGAPAFTDSNELVAPSPNSNFHDSYNQQQQSFDLSNGLSVPSAAGRLSNTYGVPSAQGANVPSFDSSDSIAVDAAGRSGNSFSSHVPSSTYGAPGNGFGGGSRSSQSGAPSSVYGPPQARNNNFGNGAAPSSVYGPPQARNNNFGNGGAPSQVYGPPKARNNNFGNGAAPSSVYGPPQARNNNFGNGAAPSSVYGPPQARNNNFANSAAPSQVYGPPQARNNNFGNGAAPSSVYGPPQSSSFSSPSGRSGQLPSATYGAPFERNGFGSQGSSGFQGYEPSKRSQTTEDPFAEPAKYEYDYKVQASDETGTEFGHKESRENESARGAYHVLLPDGRMQIVQYEADETGYRPQIRYEDTGYPSAASSRSNNGFNGYQY